MTEEPRFDPRHDPIFQRGYESGGGPTRPSSTSARGASAAAPHVEAAGPTELGPGFAMDAPRNPFTTALWITGPALVVGGVAIQVQAAQGGYNSAPSSGDFPLEMIFQQISWTVSPTMIAAGLTTVLGLVFLRAVRWRAG